MDEGVSVLNELIIPCMHLIMNNHVSRDDLEAIEVMRNRWCAYLGKDVGGKTGALGATPTSFCLLCLPLGALLVGPCKKTPACSPGSPPVCWSLPSVLYIAMGVIFRVYVYI